MCNIIIFNKFSIQTRTGLGFISGMSCSELVDLASVSNLSPDDQDITYTVSKKGSGKLEVELTVKSKSGQNVTQVDATVISKIFKISDWSCKIGNNKIYIYTVYDDWEAEAGSKNPNRRMELQGIQYSAMSSGDIYVTPYYRLKGETNYTH